jgi:predicted DsbA family dithiol-disulfide isomerase
MAMPAAQRFEALALQDPAKAWAFYDRVFREQRTLAGGETALQKIAAETGADMKRLDEDLRSDRVSARIAVDVKEAAALRFDGVPVFVVNGHVVAGASRRRCSSI